MNPLDAPSKYQEGRKGVLEWLLRLTANSFHCCHQKFLLQLTANLVAVLRLTVNLIKTLYQGSYLARPPLLSSVKNILHDKCVLIQD